MQREVGTRNCYLRVRLLNIRYPAKLMNSRDQLCAGVGTKYDACQGDSGGGLFLADYKYTLIGVISFGEDCRSGSDRPGFQSFNSDIS